MSYKVPVFALRLLLCFVVFVAAVRAHGDQLRPAALEAEISAKMPSVLEFEYIKQEAKRLNVRVWLFGGTAAGFGHYVAWDLRRRGGDTRYQPERFDYDYTNIYRSTQDLDIVIDGTPEQARALQHLLIEKNAKKLFQHAVNMEYAAKIMDKLGLREKLVAIHGDVGTVDSLAWWMNKAPLKSFDVGGGTGKTAVDLKLDIVAHETKDFLAYESSTRAHTGETC